MDFEGACWLEGDCVRGWARDPGANRPVWVELCGEGLPLGIALADQREPNGCGFSLAVPPAALDFSDKLEARIANSEFVIPREGDRVKEKAALLGELLVDRGLSFSGWAMDEFDNSRSIRLYALEDEKRIATALACERRWRPDKSDMHGFAMTLPAAMADGNEHLVHVRDEDGREMPGSPVRIRIISENVAEMLAGDISRAQKKFLAEMVRHMENRLPGAISVDNYAVWKEAFPVAKAEGKIRCAIGLPFCEGGKKAILSGQKNIVPQDGKPAYILLIRPEEKLHPHALALMISTLEREKAAAVYADAEDAYGRPLLKPAWDKLAFMGKDYLGPMLVAGKVLENTDLPRSYGAARVVAAMAAEKAGPFMHLPQILSREMPVENDAERRHAAQKALEPDNPGIEVSGENLLRIHFPLTEKPRVSVIIPTRDHGAMLGRCIASLQTTDWPDLEVIIADNGTEEAEALELLAGLERKPGFRVLRLPGVFNFSRLNNRAAERATGELICFLNNDTEITAPGWLGEMAGILLAGGLDVGAVGAKLLWPNRLVQHGGVVMGIHGLAGHVGNAWLEDDAGYMDRNQIAQQYSAVTAACLLTPKKLFMELGGFDERDFAVNFNDVDYCMRVREVGKKICWTPHASLLHHESASRGKDENPAARARAAKEMRVLRYKWGCFEDKFYNPNLPLSTVTEPFKGLAFPPRKRNAR